MVTLVLNSPCIDLDLLRKLATKSVLIGVDGGLNSISKAGLTPDWAVGDFDSVQPDLLEKLAGKSKVLRYPVEKDYTDIELALRLAGIYRPCRLNVLGLGGGDRFDHQLVNSIMLSNLALSGCQVTAWTGRQILVFTTGLYILPRAGGQMFSVFALQDPVVVSIWGAKYSGTRLNLFPGSGYGLGNQIIKQQALVGIKKGVAGICQWELG